MKQEDNHVVAPYKGTGLVRVQATSKTMLCTTTPTQISSFKTWVLIEGRMPTDDSTTKPWSQEPNSTKLDRRLITRKKKRKTMPISTSTVLNQINWPLINKLQRRWIHYIESPNSLHTLRKLTRKPSQSTGLTSTLMMASRKERPTLTSETIRWWAIRMKRKQATRPVTYWRVKSKDYSSKHRR